MGIKSGKPMRTGVERDEDAVAREDVLLEALQVDPLPHKVVPRAEVRPVLRRVRGLGKHRRHLVWICTHGVAAYLVMCCSGSASAQRVCGASFVSRVQGLACKDSVAAAQGARRTCGGLCEKVRYVLE